MKRSASLTIIAGAPEPDIVIPIRWGIVQVQTKYSCVGSIIPIPTAQETAVRFSDSPPYFRS